jgi:hypothetical protein
MHGYAFLEPTAHNLWSPLKSAQNRSKMAHSGRNEPSIVALPKSETALLRVISTSSYSTASGFAG